MNSYTHILLAVDFSEHTSNVVHKAKQLANHNGAILSIIHVLDNLPFFETSYAPLGTGLSEQIRASAQSHLTEIAKSLAIPKTQQWLELGCSTLEITRIANENKVDLIVVGSHGRHGLALLLGSTANGVLHHASCDVLAVRLKK